MKFMTAAVLAAALGVGSLGAAQASPTYSTTIDISIPTDFTYAVDGQTFGLSEFGALNIPGGSLTGVAFDLSGTSQATGSITNKSTQVQNYTVTDDVMFTLTRPDSTTLVVTEPAYSNTGTVAGRTVTKTVIGHDKKGHPIYGNVIGPNVVKTFTGTPVTLANSKTYTDAADLALFGGIDQISLPVFLTDKSAFSGSGNVADDISTKASADLHVTYYYKIVAPEPAAVAPFVLGGLGLLGLVLRGRKARAA